MLLKKSDVGTLHKHLINLLDFRKDKPELNLNEKIICGNYLLDEGLYIPIHIGFNYQDSFKGKLYPYI